MSRLAQRAVQSLVDSSGISKNDTCEILFTRSVDEFQFVENAFLGALGQLTARTIVGSVTAKSFFRVHIQPMAAQVQYENFYREGFLGSKRAERLVILEISGNIVKYPEGVLLYAGLNRQQYRDTVNVSSLETLESGPVKVARPEVSQETFFDRILEPFVIIVTGGILVYLLFTVRS